MLSGDNSILQKAADAKTESEKGQEQEIVSLAYNSALAKKVGNGDSTPVTSEDMNTELTNQGATADGNDPIIVTFTASKRQYSVDNGIVDYAGIKTDNPTENGLEGLSNAEIALLPTGVTEKSIESISNENLKDTTKIKTVITDSDNGEVPIPKNANYKEGTESTGLVIVYKGSEFVWVPVPEINKMVMCDKHTSGNCDIQINSAGTGLECRTEGHKVSSTYNTEIVGRLYATYSAKDFNANLTTQTYNDELREPSLIEGNGANVYDEKSEIYNTILGYDSASDFLEALKEEYKTMALSVAKYGGFYIGRYETSIDGTTVASKKSPVQTGDGAIMPMTTQESSGNTWYGMYNKQKEFSTSGLQSSMIWGSQYDAMLIWASGGTNSDHITATSNGNHTGSLKGTGTTENDKINNIYDLEGNTMEWTLARGCYSCRMLTGGFYMMEWGGAYSHNDYGGPFITQTTNNSSDYAGSRLTLYIK